MVVMLNTHCFNGGWNPRVYVDYMSTREILYTRSQHANPFLQGMCFFLGGLWIWSKNIFTIQWFLLCVIFWLAVSTNLKNPRQTWSFPQVGVKIKNDWNHHLVLLRHQYLTLLDLFWPYFCCPTTILLPKVVVIHATCTPQVWSGSNEKDMNVTIFWRGIEQNSLKDGQQICNLRGSPHMIGWNCQFPYISWGHFFFRIRLGLGDGCSWYETKYQSNCLDKIRPKFILYQHCITNWT